MNNVIVYKIYYLTILYFDLIINNKLNFRILSKILN
jgi:hypothetical protein